MEYESANSLEGLNISLYNLIQRSPDSNLRFERQQ